MTPASFLDQTTAMVNELHEVATAPNFDTALAPGEPEYLTEQGRSKTGIPVEDHVWEKLTELADATSVA